MAQLTAGGEQHPRIESSWRSQTSGLGSPKEEQVPAFEEEGHVEE
jgi:hypothetical protein